MASGLNGTLTGEVSLEVAQTADMDVLLRMMVDFNAGEQIAVDEERLRPALGRLLAEPSLGRVWLIRCAGELQGYTVVTLGYDLEFAGPDAFITELYLRPPARGRGLGRAALAQIEAATSALGAHALHLMVRPENTAAVALYASRGFTSPPRTFLSKVLAPEREAPERIGQRRGAEREP